MNLSMMNFKSDIKTNDLLDKIVDLVNEVALADQVDEPIDYSAASFECKVPIPVTHKVFNRGIAAFIQHLYQSGLRLCRFITDEQALSEAILLLDSTYENEEAKGYDGALLDATGKGIEGLEMVLTRLLESIKTAERTKYIKWIFADHVDCKDWREREEMVLAYLKRYKRYLPDNLVNLDPARLIEFLPDLILSLTVSENITAKALWS